jgi:polar amino acid transport system permease protein
MEPLSQAFALSAFLPEPMLEVARTLPHKLDLIWGSMPYVLGGAGVTIATVAAALALGFVCGLPLAVVQVYGPVWAGLPVRVYVWFFRGVPILLLLFLFYFGLFKLLNLDMDAVAACSVVLGLTSAAYQSQIFRGAMLSLPQGQMRAALALGMSETQALGAIVVPQALRLSIPGWSNEYSILLKDSALCFALGAPDIMARATAVASRTYEHMTMYIIVGILYFAITWAGVRLLHGLERRVHIPGYAAPGV